MPARRESLKSQEADVLVFLDGDHSFSPSDLPSLLAPILNDQADLVLGSRVLGHIEPGAMFPQQRFGNWLVSRLTNLLYGLSITDLGTLPRHSQIIIDAIGHARNDVWLAHRDDRKVRTAGRKNPGSPCQLSQSTFWAIQSQWHRAGNRSGGLAHPSTSRFDTRGSISTSPSLLEGISKDANGSGINVKIFRGKINLLLCQPGLPLICPVISQHNRFDLISLTI